jgi:hypothetical protein
VTIGRWTRWRHTTGHWSLWHRTTRGEDRMLCTVEVPHGVAKLEIAEEPGSERCYRCVTRLRRLARRPQSMDQRDFRHQQWG